MLVNHRAAVHAMREAFNSDSEGMLLIDATFNSLNRAVALYNIQRLCPSFSVLINTYRHPACLFGVDGDTVYSEERTTQGDPLAMPFYALATVSLIKKVVAPVTQIRYADDAAACGKIFALRAWWDQVVSLGPQGRGSCPSSYGKSRGNSVLRDMQQSIY